MKKKEYKYVLFDVANTLLYKPDLFKVISKTLENYEILIPESVIEEKHKLLTETIVFPDETSREFYLIFNKMLLMNLGIVPHVEIIESIYNSCRNLKWKPYDDVDVLSKLRIPVGILSNWDQNIETILSESINYKFDDIISSYKVGISKPDTAFFNYAIKKINCKTDEILYIGDLISLDIIPARSIGIEALLIDRSDIYKYYNLPKIKSLHDILF